MMNARCSQLMKNQWIWSRSASGSTCKAYFPRKASLSFYSTLSITLIAQRILPDLRFPIITSDDELRAFLLDGTVLCRILNRLRPDSVTECSVSENSNLENVKRFLTAMDDIGLPRFELVDLEKGSMKLVIECLLTLKSQFAPREGGYTLRKSSSAGSDAMMKWKLLGIGGPEGSSRPYPVMLPSVERRKSMPDSKFRRVLRSHTMSEPSAALLHHVGHKFQEVFQMKHGGYGDLSAAKIYEMMKANSLDDPINPL